MPQILKTTPIDIPSPFRKIPRTLSGMSSTSYAKRLYTTRKSGKSSSNTWKGKRARCIACVRMLLCRLLRCKAFPCVSGTSSTLAMVIHQHNPSRTPSQARAYEQEAHLRVDQLQELDEMRRKTEAELVDKRTQAEQQLQQLSGALFQPKHSIIRRPFAKSEPALTWISPFPYSYPPFTFPSLLSAAPVGSSQNVWSLCPYPLLGLITLHLAQAAQAQVPWYSPS